MRENNTKKYPKKQQKKHVPAPPIATDGSPAPWSEPAAASGAEKIAGPPAPRSELAAASGAEKTAGPPELLAIEEYLKSESKSKEPAAPKEPPAPGNKLPPNGAGKMTGPPDFMDGPAITAGTTGKVGAACTGDPAPRNGPIKPGIFLFDGAITAPDAINRKHFL